MARPHSFTNVGCATYSHSKSVRLPVCLSVTHCCNLSKRLDISSNSFTAGQQHHSGFLVNNLCYEILTGSPLP